MVEQRLPRHPERHVYLRRHQNGVENGQCDDEKNTKQDNIMKDEKNNGITSKESTATSTAGRDATVIVSDNTTSVINDGLDGMENRICVEQKENEDTDVLQEDTNYKVTSKDIPTSYGTTLHEGITIERNTHPNSDRANNDQNCYSGPMVDKISKLVHGSSDGTTKSTHSETTIIRTKYDSLFENNEKVVGENCSQTITETSVVKLENENPVDTNGLAKTIIQIDDSGTLTQENEEHNTIRIYSGLDSQTIV